MHTTLNAQYANLHNDRWVLVDDATRAVIRTFRRTRREAPASGLAVLVPGQELMRVSYARQRGIIPA